MALLFIAALLACLAAQCSGATKLRVLSYTTSYQAAVVAGFEAANPGVTVEVDTTSIAEMPAKLAAVFAAQDPPYDVVMVGISVAVYATTGKIVDLSSTLGSFNWGDIVFPARVFAQLEGRPFAAPIDSNPMMIHHDRAEVPLAPGTWSELERVAETLRARHPTRTGWAPLCMPTRGVFSLMAMIVANSVFRVRDINAEGFLWDLDTGHNTPMTSVLRTAGWEYVLEIIRSLWAFTDGQEHGSEEATTMFIKRQCSLFLSFPTAANFAAVDPASLLRGSYGTRRLPGSRVVYDRATRRLRQCDASLCPFAIDSINQPDFFAGASQLCVLASSRGTEAVGKRFIAYYTRHADPRVAGAVNPFRSGHFNTTYFVEGGWLQEDAKDFVTALQQVDLHTLRTFAMLPAIPTGQVVTDALDKHLLRFVKDPALRAADVLADLEAEIAANSRALGYGPLEVEQALRASYSMTPLQVSSSSAFRFPDWAYAVACVVPLVLVIPLVLICLPRWRLRHAPLEGSFVVCFVAPRAVYINDHPQSIKTTSRAIAHLNRLVADAARESSCYPAKVMSGFHMVVAKSAVNGARFAATLQQSVRDADWAEYLLTPQEAAADVARRQALELAKPKRRRQREGTRRRRAEGRMDASVSHSIEGMSESGMSSRSSRSTRSTSTRHGSRKSRAYKRTTADSESPPTARSRRRHIATDDSEAEGDERSVVGGDEPLQDLLRPHRVDVSVGLHYGEGSAADADGHTLEYTGPVVDEAAEVTDTAAGGQTLASEDYVREVGEQRVPGTFTVFTRRPKAQERLQRLYQFNPFSMEARQFPQPSDTNGEPLDVGVSKALALVTGGLAVQRVTVLSVRIDEFDVNLMSDARMARDVVHYYTAYSNLIEAAVKRRQGELLSSVNGTFIATFNTKHPSSSHAANAAACALDICNELENHHDTSASCGLCIDRAYVGAGGSNANGERRNVLLTAALAHAELLSMLASSMQVRCLTLGHCGRDFGATRLVEQVDLLRLPNGAHPSSIISIFAPDSQGAAQSGSQGGAAQDDDWLYATARGDELEDGAGGAVGVNRGFRALEAGDLKTARECLDAINGEGWSSVGRERLTEVTDQLLERIEAREEEERRAERKAAEDAAKAADEEEKARVQAEAAGQAETPAPPPRPDDDVKEPEHPVLSDDPELDPPQRPHAHAPVQTPEERRAVIAKEELALLVAERSKVFFGTLAAHVMPKASHDIAPHDVAGRHQGFHRGLPV